MVDENMDEKMDGLEEQVREGLRRVDAPAGFADRVMQRVAANDAAKGAAKPAVKLIPMRAAKHWRAWQSWAVAAALLVAVAGGVAAERYREQQIAGEQARAQVMTALQITSAQLQRVNEQINGQ